MTRGPTASSSNHPDQTDNETDVFSFPELTNNSLVQSIPTPPLTNKDVDEWLEELENPEPSNDQQADLAQHNAGINESKTRPGSPDPVFTEDPVAERLSDHEFVNQMFHTEKETQPDSKSSNRTAEGTREVAQSSLNVTLPLGRNELHQNKGENKKSNKTPPAPQYCELCKKQLPQTRVFWYRQCLQCDPLNTSRID